MFESVRRHQRIFLGIVLLLIIPSFVVVGAWDLISPGGGAGTVATVGRQKIQYPQWERAHQQAIDQVRQQLGGRIDPAMLDSPAARAGTLEELVNRQILLMSADDYRLRVSDAQLQRAIATIPQIQRNGKFDMELYQKALKAQGLTADMFERQVRADLAIEALPSALGASSIVPRSVVRRLAQTTQETRSFRVRKLALSDALGSVSASDAEIEQYYQSNQARFQTPEEIDISFVIFSKPAKAEAAEQFANLVYEQSDSLDAAAKKFGLSIQSAQGVRREGMFKGSADAQRLLSNPRMLAALFSADALINKRNTEAIELAPGVLASARVVKHKPAAPQPIASVRGQIEKLIRERKASEAVTDQAKAITAKGSEALASLGPSRSLTRAAAAKSDLPIEVLEAIFSAELPAVPKLLTVAASATQPAAWVIAVESAKVPAQDSPAVKDVVGRAFAQLDAAHSRDTLELWLAARKEAIGVKLYPEKLTNEKR